MQIKYTILIARTETENSEVSIQHIFFFFCLVLCRSTRHYMDLYLITDIGAGDDDTHYNVCYRFVVRWWCVCR